MDSDDEDAQFLSLSTTKNLSTIDLVQDVPKKPQLSIEKDIISERAKLKAEQYETKQKQRGVVYLGQIPPKMSPKYIRTMLSQFGTLDRVYLEPENEDKYRARKQRTHNHAGGLRYNGGWVEFLDKRHAKKCALVLNGSPMSSTTQSRQYKDDLWCIKYLSKVKWEDIHATQRHDANIHNVKKAKILDASAKESQRIAQYHEDQQERRIIAKKQEAKQRKRELRDKEAEDAPPATKKQKIGAPSSSFRRLD